MRNEGDVVIKKAVEDLWESWLENRHAGTSEKERAFWRGYALGRRLAARQLAHAAGLPDPAKSAGVGKGLDRENAA